MIKVNPYVPTRGYVVEGIDVNGLRKLRNELGETPISVFTEKEFDLLQYAPSILFKINSDHGLNFPIDRDHSRRQLEVDIINQYSVLESAVQRSYYNNADFVHNKATSFIKISTRISNLVSERSLLGGACGYYQSDFPLSEEIDRKSGIPIPFGLFDYCPAHLSSIQDRLDFVYQLKQSYSALIGKQNILDRGRNNIRLEERRKDMHISSDLKEIFGKNIDVVMFGSATYEDSDNKDYDFIVLTDHIRKEHFRDLENANLRLNNKPVDVVLVRKKYWENYVVKNPFSQGIVRDGLLLRGILIFQYWISMKRFCVLSQGPVGRIRTLHGVALNWAGLRPNELLDKSGLLVSLSKVPSYVLRGLLELRGMENNRLDRRYIKSDLEEILSDIGLKRIDFSEDFFSKNKFTNGWLFSESAIQDSLYEIMVQTAQVVDRFYSPKWINDYKEQINKVNNPDEWFLTKIKEELEMEKYLYESWNIVDVK